MRFAYVAPAALPCWPLPAAITSVRATRWRTTACGLDRPPPPKWPAPGDDLERSFLAALPLVRTYEATDSALILKGAGGPLAQFRAR